MSKTRLELAVKLRKESGIDGDGPTSTLNQVGEYGMIVDWIDDAYERIQSEHEDWQFLRKEFSIELTSGVQEYTPAEAGLADLSKWMLDDVRLYLTSSGISNEQEIFYIPWEDFKRTYLFGNARAERGRPIHFTVKPNNSIVFWPIPNYSYTSVGEYYQAPYIFSADSDLPAFPGNFHMILVWGALYYYGANYVEHDRYVHGMNEYKKMKHMMEISQRPMPGWGGPLA